VQVVGADDLIAMALLQVGLDAPAIQIGAELATQHVQFFVQLRIATKRYNKTLVSITKEKNVLDEVVKNNNLVLGDCE